MLVLMKYLNEIQDLKIEGEPSERNTLDTRVFAEKFRLGELITRRSGTATMGSGEH